MKAQAYFANRCLVTLALAVGFGAVAYGQEANGGLKESIDSKQFVFHAQSALPTTGGVRQLTSEYELRVLDDSLVSQLPFFGRAYSVNYGVSDGGYNFSSSDFSYNVKQRKKGGWDIRIKPRDVADFREFSLVLSEDGHGTLQVLSNNRQPISFTGYVTSTRR